MLDKYSEKKREINTETSMMTTTITTNTQQTANQTITVTATDIKRTPTVRETIDEPNNSQRFIDSWFRC